MKIISIIILCYCFAFNISAQTFNPGDYTKGTSTIESIKSKYTLPQIRSMLDSAEIYKSIGGVQRLGIQLTDPVTSENMIICDVDSTMMLFEYNKKLRQEIIILKQRLQIAGIP